MADDAPSPEITINIKGPSELKLQISISTDKTVRELKEAIAAKSDAEADRQRLIYSGRVLKDDDLLSVYKIQNSHTIHMVKSAARAGGSSQSSSTPQPLPTMQTGQNVHDPLTQLNSHLGFGAMAGLNPFSDMGVNTNDPNLMQSMMNSPEFLQQMASVMGNPQVMDQIIASNPQLAAMGPQVREVFQSERFRQLLSNPEQLRTMLQMASMFGPGAGGGAGAGGAGGFGGASPFSLFGGGAGAGGGFPAPGVPNTGSTTTPTTPSSTTANPSSTPQPQSPFGRSGMPPFNPFGADPALMQQLLGSMGGGAGLGAGAGAGAGLGSLFGAPPAPADTRSPEERYQVQLQQLQEMGFSNATQNVRALLATAGNVQAAIEYILSGGGM
ncbi:hypothetical protein ONZ45_g16134 [Pleurotus djamor]|nr:hypothetical protein ONZ45_g16134 [Pleurotus djamor]